jgi:hypothetical protein
MDLVLPLTVAFCAGLAFVLHVAMWLWRRRRPLRLCPGPALSWRQRLIPLWLFYRRRCGYDLSGHFGCEPRREHPSKISRQAGIALANPITCPECGRRVHQRRELCRTASHWRPAGIALVLGGLALQLHHSPPIAASRLVAMAPTDVLLRGETLLGTTTPLEVREELRRRAMDHQLSDPEVSRFVDVLVNDLRDDQLLGNAKDALEKLAIFATFDPGPLYRVIDSPDAQQRRYVRDLLRDLPHAGYPPQELIDASIQDLASDEVGSNLGSARWFLREHLERATPSLIAALTSGFKDQRHSGDEQQQEAIEGLLRSATVSRDVSERLVRLALDDLRVTRSWYRTGEAFRYVLRTAPLCESILAEGMKSDDARVRLLSAAAAGCTQRTALLEQAAPLLIEHLGDNLIRGDAVVAARALWGFGPGVIPHVKGVLAKESARAGTAGGDEQRRQALHYLLARFEGRETLGSLQRRWPLARLTLARVDAMALDPEELDVPSWRLELEREAEREEQAPTQ